MASSIRNLIFLIIFVILLMFAMLGALYNHYVETLHMITSERAEKVASILKKKLSVSVGEYDLKTIRRDAKIAVEDKEIYFLQIRDEEDHEMVTEISQALTKIKNEYVFYYKSPIHDPSRDEQVVGHVIVGIENIHAIKSKRDFLIYCLIIILILITSALCISYIMMKDYRKLDYKLTKEESLAKVGQMTTAIVNQFGPFVKNMHDEFEVLKVILGREKFSKDMLLEIINRGIEDIGIVEKEISEIKLYNVQNQKYKVSRVVISDFYFLMKRLRNEWYGKLDLKFDFTALNEIRDRQIFIYCQEEGLLKVMKNLLIFIEENKLHSSSNIYFRFNDNENELSAFIRGPESDIAVGVNTFQLESIRYLLVDMKSELLFDENTLNQFEIKLKVAKS